MIRILIRRGTRGLRSRRAVLAADELTIVVPTAARRQHVVRRILVPAVDEVAVEAVPVAPGVAARELERRLAAPAVGHDRLGVVARGVPELRHHLHPVWALAGVVTEVVFREVLRVDAVGEAQRDLEVLVADGGWELGNIGLALVGALAEPLQCVGRVVGRGLGLGRCVPRDHGEVLGDGDLGEGVVVVGTEAEDRDLGEGAVVDVVERGNPCRLRSDGNGHRSHGWLGLTVGRQVIRVFSAVAAFLQVSRRRHHVGNGIASGKRVHV